MGDNIREIESAIINLNAHAKMLSQDITLEFAKHVMKEQIKDNNKNITLEDIIKTISKELNVKPSDIKSKKRTKNIVEARRIGIYLARTLTPNSMPALASYFDMKDHTAVSHNMKKINEMLESNENFKVRVEEIKNKIASKES
jgi:chromosomal replication initiator protein